jgi:hypothetical protein
MLGSVRAGSRALVRGPAAAAACRLSAVVRAAEGHHAAYTPAIAGSWCQPSALARCPHSVLAGERRTLLLGSGCKGSWPLLAASPGPLARITAPCVRRAAAWVCIAPAHPLTSPPVPLDCCHLARPMQPSFLQRVLYDAPSQNSLTEEFPGCVAWGAGGTQHAWSGAVQRPMNGPDAFQQDGGWADVRCRTHH